MIRCTCPHCHTIHKLDNLLMGQPFTCTDCGRRLRVPSQQTGTATPFAVQSVAVPLSLQPVAAKPLTALPADTARSPRLALWSGRLFGIVLTFVVEFLLALVWAQGNHRDDMVYERNRAAIDAKYPHTTNEYEEARREYPRLSWEEQMEIANRRIRERHRLWNAANKQNLRENHSESSSRTRLHVGLGLVVLMVGVGASFGLWQKLYLAMRQPPLPSSPARPTS
ncbi:MAG TPA: hypothetical protein VH575_09090 [Gemmataceae bacterium]|jgi:hypothetical protein